MEKYLKYLKVLNAKLRNDVDVAEERVRTVRIEANRTAFIYENEKSEMFKNFQLLLKREREYMGMTIKSLQERILALEERNLALEETLEVVFSPLQDQDPKTNSSLPVPHAVAPTPSAETLKTSSGKSAPVAVPSFAMTPKDIKKDKRKHDSMLKSMGHA